MHSDIFYSNLFFILIMVLTHKIDFIAQKETLTCSLKNAALKHKLTFKDKPSYYSCINSHWDSAQHIICVQEIFVELLDF